MGDDHMSLLASCNQLVFDAPSEVFKRHSLTTEEIRELCKDVKVSERRRRRGRRRNTLWILYPRCWVFESFVSLCCGGRR